MNKGRQRPFAAIVQTAGPLEALLVDRITANAWRLRKTLEAESWYQDYHAGKYLEGPETDTWGNVDSRNFRRRCPLIFFRT